MRNKDYIKEVTDSDSPRKLIMWPRRAGKTTYIIQSAIKDMLQGKNIVIVGPNKSYCRIIQNLISEEFKYNILLQPYVHFINKNFDFLSNIVKLQKPFGSIICLEGESCQMHKVYPDSIYVDEGQSIDLKVYTNLILPMLDHSEETTLEILFTPRILCRHTSENSGIRFINTLWEEDPQWEHFHTTFSSLDCADKVKKIKNSISWNQFRTEYLAEWVIK